MANHLEQLISEWLEFKGYFVHRNVKVGKLAHGGHAGLIYPFPEKPKGMHWRTYIYGCDGRQMN